MLSGVSLSPEGPGIPALPSVAAARNSSHCGCRLRSCLAFGILVTVPQVPGPSIILRSAFLISPVGRGQRQLPQSRRATGS